MFSPKFILICVAGMLCIFVCAGDSKFKRCVETEKQALLKLKHGFIDDGHILSSWNGEVDCCQWNGISCNNMTGHVTKLFVSGENYPGYYQLRGNISLSLCELQYLTHLDLSFYYSKGSEIPKCIGSLTQLRELILSSSGFVGTIPHELQNLTNLQTLDLSWNNDLVPKSLEWISHLTSLRYLNLSRVNLSQAIDWQTSLSSILPSLVEIHLDNCYPHQVNRKSFFHVNSSTSLKILSLALNNLDSSILSWVSNISKVLEYLDLGRNSLQYIAPDVFASATCLEHLFLDDNELESSMVNSISNLCQLKELDLSFNKLSTPLNEWIPQLGCAQNSIGVLGLSDNNLSGRLPEFVGLPFLESLDLSHNKFDEISGSFGHLPNLSDLRLSYNNFSGRLPEFVGLPFLGYLDLSNNKFDEIPSSFGQLSSLFSLDLSSNKLKGVFNETNLSTLSDLRDLDVSHNSISFNFSSNWVPTFQLEDLYASSCIIGPNFPLWLKNQTELQYLEFSDGGISDLVPQWLWLSPNLVYLNLSHNKIHGELPKESAISFLDLSFNNFSGLISYFPPYAEVLMLSNNKLSAISSNLPDCWGAQFPSLRVLNLANNNISGRIPISIGNLESIESIHLNNNYFFGELPNMMNLSNLKLIDFGQNHLNGNLPTWIGNHLASLIVLRLTNNKFQGSIPVSLCNLQLLQVLDISHNNFTGTIPHCFNNLSVLSNVTFSRDTISYHFGNEYDRPNRDIPPMIDNAMLAWKGNDIEYNKNLGYMASIDLSCNQLGGEIPSSIVTLVALESLNLSRNKLTGFIPNNMGQMKWLESLDLSSNFLSGEIPTSFSSLSFLSYLNLSFNNLSGEIPQTTQLQTFDASRYEGNQGLCGPPLPQCSTLDHPLPHDFTQDKEDKLISFGFYVSLILGFIIGFWGVCGSLIVKRSWRQAYFQFFSDINDWTYVQVVLLWAKIKRRFQD